MATIITGLTAVQQAALKQAFGYERYPNGNSGHTRQAVEWMTRNHADSILGSAAGAPEFASAIKFKPLEFTAEQVDQLLKYAQQRSKK